MADFDQEINQFLNYQKALIVEPSNAFFSVIQSCLTGLGMSGSNIVTANNYHDAISLMAEYKPKILITEYTIGKYFGLALVEKHDEIYDSLSRISIMVTKETSDTAVAEAAEEQLDAYIVKPFSMLDFKNRLLEVIKRKMYPSQYFEKIREGKNFLKNNQTDEAISVFTEAKGMTPKPTLACYYLGECFVNQKNHSLARAQFKEGRTYNELHYKCLIGEFDSLMYECNYREAYGLVKIIRQNYPVTSARLGKFFIAAVYTESFQDLDQLCDLYMNLDFRPPELINLVSLAFITAGRYYLRKKNSTLAINYFEIATTVTGRGIEYLEKIIDDLLKVEEVAAAEKFLKYVKADDISSSRYQQLNFKVGRFVLPSEQIMEQGRKIIVEGKANPEVVKLVVKLAAESGKQTLAESLIIKGVEMYPEIRKELYEILETTSKKS